MSGLCMSGICICIYLYIYIYIGTVHVGYMYICTYIWIAMSGLAEMLQVRIVHRTS